MMQIKSLFAVAPSPGIADPPARACPAATGEEIFR